MLSYANANTLKDITGSTLRCKVIKTYIMTTGLDNKSIKVEKGGIKSNNFYYTLSSSNNGKNVFMYDRLLRNTLKLTTNKDGIVIFESEKESEFHHSDNIVEYNLDTHDLVSIASRFNRANLTITVVKNITKCT